MIEPSPLDYLSVDDLLEIASGVIGEVLLRDPGLLASAVARPQTSVFGTDAYPSFAEKAAALMHSLARNHPLVDGNKRLAWSATRVFALMNGRDVVFTVDDAETLVLGVAAGSIDVPELAAVLAEHMVEAPSDGPK
ncbi:MAG: type II toxin-antitoxin system death-on-curing family toxin [Actinomycetes bacterium]